MPLTRFKLTAIADDGITSAKIDDNIHLDGTEAIRVPVGTTAQRANETSGDIRFNSTTSLMEYYDGTDWKPIDTPPTVTSISPTTETDANANIVITGTSFSSGATVKFIGNDGTEYASPTVTVDSTTQITATTPTSALTVANEPYDVKVIATSGLSGVLEDALDAGGTPTWNTSSGQIGGTIFEGESVSTSISATEPDGDTLTYSVQSGALPTGLTLNSSTGAITGTAPTVSADTTSTFTARASDGVNTADRSFNIIVRNETYNEVDFFGDSSGLALYQLNSATTDTSGNYNATGMITGTATYNTSTKAFGSASFDAGSGTANIIDLPTVKGSYPYTISAWVYRSEWNNSSTVGQLHCEIVNADIGGQRVTHSIVDFTNNGQFEFTIMYGGTDHWTFAYPITMVNNNWYHVIYSVVGSTNSSHAVYVNGNAASATNQGGGHGGSAGWTIGGNASGTEHFKDGLIDHVRIFNKALSSSEATSLYNAENERLGLV